MINENNTLTYDQETELAEIFRPNAHIGLAVNKVKSFLKRPEVQELADNDLRFALMKNDITVNYVIEKRKQVIDKAYKGKQYNAVNVALDRLEQHLGLNNKITVTETRKIDSNLEQNFQKAKNDTKITISTEVNIPKTEDNEETSNNK